MTIFNLLQDIQKKKRGIEARKLQEIETYMCALNNTTDWVAIYMCL